MQSNARVVPIRRDENACLQCVFLNRCLSRCEDGRGPCACISVAPRVFHRGDHLFRAHETFHDIFVVRSGAVKTYVIQPSGEEQVIGFHTPGDMVGLDAIESRRHTCNAMVLDTSCVCPLPFEQIVQLGARSPAIQTRLTNRLSRKIVDHEALLQILGQKTAEQRMAAFLLHFSRKQHALGLAATEINLPMSRADIASYLALAVETVSRVLTRLQERGLLEVKRNLVGIRDLESLEQLAEEPPDAAPRRARSGAQRA